MSASIYLLTIGLPLAAVVLIFVMKYGSAALAARSRTAAEADYRALAEKAAAAQVETQASLAAMQADLARLAASLAGVEKMLKEVG